MRILSLAALTILDAGPIGQTRAAIRAGWRSVGLRLQPLVETDVAVAGNSRREAELRRDFDASGLRLLEAGVFPIGPNFRLDVFLPALDLAAALGGAFAVAPVEDPDSARRTSSFAAFSAAASERGLRALVEFNPYSACKTLGAATTLLAEAGDERAALCLDTLHFFRSGGSIDELSRVDPAAIALIHFCDAAVAPPASASEDDLRRESRTARRLPGEGVLPLRDFLAALPADAPLSLEAPSPRLAGATADMGAAEALRIARSWLDDAP